MKFDFASQVGGRPLATARDFLRKYSSPSAEDATRFLQSSVAEGSAYIAALCDAGHLEPDDPFHSQAAGEFFKPTRLGVHLRKAKMTKRIDRARADQAVTALLTAVGQINSDPDLLCWVSEIDLFGSYAGGAANVGDVDVAVCLEPRLDHDAWRKASMARATTSGRRLNFVERMCWGELEVIKRLRDASKYLDIQLKAEIAQLDCQLQPLYRRETAVEPAK